MTTSRRGHPVGPTGSVVVRALGLLDAFGPDRAALSLSDLARHADVPLSTAHRLVADLAGVGCAGA